MVSLWNVGWEAASLVLPLNKIFCSIKSIFSNVIVLQHHRWLQCYHNQQNQWPKHKKRHPACNKPEFPCKQQSCHMHQCQSILFGFNIKPVSSLLAILWLLSLENTHQQKVHKSCVNKLYFTWDTFTFCPVVNVKCLPKTAPESIIKTKDSHHTVSRVCVHAQISPSGVCWDYLSQSVTVWQ